MTITATTFRTNFPAFADTAGYPDGAIAFWLGIAALQMNVPRWGQLLDFGTQLFIAHNLVLEKQAMDAVAAGGNPGTETGVVSSDSVDKASVAYDTSGAAALDAGHWNLTTYGMRYISLARKIGSGGMQL
jgi:hypothetical protein